MKESLINEYRFLFHFEISLMLMKIKDGRKLSKSFSEKGKLQHTLANVINV